MSLHSRPAAAALAALLAFSPAVALADPPDWAPAHGWRAKHGGKDVQWHEDAPSGLSGFYGLPVGIEQGRCDRGLVGANVGTVLGALAGGLLGSQFGKGDGKVAMTAAGVLLGAVLGNQTQAQFDAADEGCMAQTLERAPNGQQIVWDNPDSGARYQVTPVRTFESNGANCREYTSRAVIGGRSETVTGTACRQPDGAWKIVN